MIFLHCCALFGPKIAKGGGSSKVAVGKLKEGGNRMKGDVKVIVSGSSGHIVFEESKYGGNFTFRRAAWPQVHIKA